MKPIEFARSFVAARKNRRPPMTTTGLANTIAKAVEAWQNLTPREVPGAVELAAEPERMPYSMRASALQMLVPRANECGFDLRVAAYDGITAVVMLSEQEIEHCNGFELYPER